MSRSHCLRSLMMLTTVVCLLLTLHAPIAAAGVGDYSVTLAGDSQVAAFPGWYAHGNNIPQDGILWLAGPTYLSAWPSPYPQGVGEWVHLPLPDPSLTIAGGTMSGSINIENPGFRAQAMAGDAFGHSTNVLSSMNTQHFTAALPINTTWIEFGLNVDSASWTNNANKDRIDITSFNLALHDSAAPTLTITQAPNPHAWLHTGCIAYSVTTKDAGSGIADVAITAPGTDRSVDTWHAPGQAGIHPGLATVTRQGCIPLNSPTLHAGTNTFNVTVHDASGQVTTASFIANVDVAPPTITSSLGADGTVAKPDAPITVSAQDATSGVGATIFTLDGTSIDPTTTHAGSFTLQPRWKVGEHTLHVSVTDVAGNTSATDIAIHAIDATPPVISNAAGQAAGAGVFSVSATATDQWSGVDATGWTLAVDGSVQHMAGYDLDAESRIGPLAVGAHTVVVTAHDNSGNAATQQLTVTVAAPPAPPAPPAKPTAKQATTSIATAPAPAKTTVAPPKAARPAPPAVPTPPAATTVPRIKLTVAPKRYRSARYGARIRFRVMLKRGTHPVRNVRIDARQHGRLLGHGLTDVHGVAAIRIAATKSGIIAFRSELKPRAQGTARILVAPKVRLHTSTARPRRGHSFTLSGIAVPRKRGLVVQLQARIGKSWFSLHRSVRTTRNGRFSARVRCSLKGRIMVRVVTKKRAGSARGTSNTLRLKVRG